MSNIIKLDIVSDIICPWCIIGYKRLEAAIKELGIKDQVEIEWHPFELNPDMPAEGENIRDHLARKYGSTTEESIRSRVNITQLGAELGFVFDYFDEMKAVNTFDAHILLDYAKDKSKQTALKMRLFEAFYSERKDISNRQVLREELQHLGLNVDEAMSRLDDAVIRKNIRSQEAYCQQLGISGVPTIIFNRTSALTGAQPVDLYKQVLLELISS